MAMVDIDVDPSGALAIRLANTRHHDGHGGVMDDLAQPGGAAAWAVAQPEFASLGRSVLGNPALEGRLVEVRDAVRSLFAEAVSPHPPSRGEHSRRMPTAKAFARLKSAADRLQLTQAWQWTGGRVRAMRRTPTIGVDLLIGIAAVRALDLLHGGLAGELRSCQAPHCVKYFVRAHGRQEWCKTSCANRARAARFAERHRAK